jgi:hypothetical protein
MKYICNVTELICMYMEELSKDIQNSLQHNHLYILISNHAPGQFNQESLILNFNRPIKK